MRRLFLLPCLGFRRWVPALLVAAWATSSALADLRVDTGGREWVPANFPVVLELDDQIDAGGVAVLIGGRDLTDLFRRDQHQLRYRGDLLPLPAGTHTLTVFRVDPDGSWTEIAAATLQVLTPSGFESVERSPRLTATALALLDERRTPPDSAPTTPDSGTLALGGSLALLRSGWRISAEADVLGVTEVANALRFDRDGPDAERVDLASWSVRMQRLHPERPPLELALGHVTWSANRLLVGAHASRGVSLTLPGTRATLSLAATRGRAVVGWDDPLGLGHDDDLALGGELRFQLFPTRPGGLELAVAWLDGDLAAEDPFGASLVTDRERSRGLGVSLAASTPGQRLRLEALAARSRFENPFDPSLAQGAELVAVAAEERDAYAFSTEIALIQGRSWGEHPTSLVLALRHETVEPQFRSVLATLASDRASNTAEIRGNVGPAAVQLTRERAEDNLDEIPSILTTRTDRTAASILLPLGDLAHQRVWPAVTISLDRTDQRGLGVPINGDFSPSHVPDQRSDSANAQLDWTFDRVRWSYHFSGSDQDNRQIGREQADFRTRTHGLSFGWSPHNTLDLGIELDRERSLALEAGRTDRTRRFGATFAWRPLARLSLDGRYSRSRSEDDPQTSESLSRLLDLGLAWSFGGPTSRGRTWAGQVFLRYSDQDLSARDLVFVFDSLTTGRTVTAGLNLSFQ